MLDRGQLDQAESVYDLEGMYAIFPAFLVMVFTFTGLSAHETVLAVGASFLTGFAAYILDIIFAKFSLARMKARAYLSRRDT